MKPLSYSRLARFKKCETLFLLEDVSESTPAQILGKALHVRVLEGVDAFESSYCLPPINPKTEKPYGMDTLATNAHEIETGKTCLSPDMMDEIKLMSESIDSHELAQKLLQDCEVEQEIGGVMIEGLECHGRLDAFCINSWHRLIELKTCQDLDSFERDIEKFFYVHQLAFYRSLLVGKYENLVANESINCYIIGVEKSELYRTGVWRVSSYALGKAQEANATAIRRLKKCDESGIFKTGYETMKTFEGVNL